MPITGTEATLATSIHDKIKAKMEAITGQAVANDAFLQNFSEAIAEAIIPHLVTNTKVNRGQTVDVPAAGLVSAAPGQPVTGDATGTVDTDGTIS